jgi:hypothetical protein
MEKLFFCVLVFSIMGCNSGDSDLSMKVGRMPVLQSNEQLYFYRIVRGLSTDTYLLTKKVDECQGFNKNDDYYFNALGQAIYYKNSMDTLFIFTNIPVVQPKAFGFPVIQKILEPREVIKFEEMYKKNEVKKLAIDSLYKPTCVVSF